MMLRPDVLAVVKALSDTSFDEFAELGAALSGDSAFPRSVQELRELGKVWLGQMRAAIREALAQNPKIELLVKKDPGTIDSPVVIGMILDVIASAATITIPPVVLTIVVIRYGLAKFLDNK